MADSSLRKKVQLTCAGRACIVILAVLFALLPGALDAAESPERPLEKITIAYSSLSANMAPLWITHERGLFRKHGVDAQIVFIESGSTTVQSLASKEVAFAQMAGAGVLQSRLRGSDVVMIAGVINTLTFKLFVEKGIERPEQLKGKTIAVTRYGSSTDFALRYALERYGLIPEKDVTILQAGTMPAMLNFMDGGKIQGAMLSSPFTLEARKKGHRLMADLQMLGLEYQHTGLAATRALIKSRPDLVRNVMKAYVEGIHYYKTHRAESLAILGKYLKTSDNQVLTEIYEDVGLRLTATKPYPTVRGIGIMLKELAASNPKTAAAPPEDFVDMTFVKELDASGFIDELYKTTPIVAKRPEPTRGTETAQVKAPGKESAAAGQGSASKRAVPLKSGEGPLEHVVIPGDTLSQLALTYLGSSYKWELIFAANRSTMKNPHYLYVGQKILIPM
jgi:NitT/TauT family transport system substrate-binding protein